MLACYSFAVTSQHNHGRYFSRFELTNESRLWFELRKIVANKVFEMRWDVAAFEGLAG